MFDPEYLFVNVVDGNYEGFLHLGNSFYQVLEEDNMQNVKRFAARNNFMVFQTHKRLKGHDNTIN